MSRLTIAVLAAAACLSWSGAHADEVTTKTFNLAPEAKVLKCFAANAATPPTATVTVTRAGQRDHLVLTVHGLKPHLHFDVFTVQRSNLLSNGTPDPAFTGSFGLAWYQSDLNADEDGKRDDLAQLDLHRPDLRFRSGCDAGADQHIPHRFLVQ